MQTLPDSRCVRRKRSPATLDKQSCCRTISTSLRCCKTRIASRSLLTGESSPRHGKAQLTCTLPPFCHLLQTSKEKRELTYELLSVGCICTSKNAKREGAKIGFIRRSFQMTIWSSSRGLA